MSSNNARVENITLVNALQHNHHTKQAKNKNYFLSNALTSQCSNGLLVNGSKVCNELPNNIKSEARLFKFSRSIQYDIYNSRSIFSVLASHCKFPDILLFQH